MRRLILMRHGQAERPKPGLEDFERAIDAEGAAEARQAGRRLAEAGMAPDLALVSAATRTLQTWKAVSEAFGEVKTVEERDLYGASAASLVEAVRHAGEAAGAVMVVGHNPAIHQFAMLLARRCEDSPMTHKLLRGFPTGAAAVFGMDGETAPRMEALFLPGEAG